MATQNAPGILRVEMRYRYDNQLVMNVFHVHRPGEDSFWSSGQIEAVMDAFEEDYFHDNQQTMLPTTMELTEIVATDLTSLEGLKRNRAFTTAQNGTSASPGLPANATIAIKMQATTRGRGRSGRIFWPALTEAGVVDNRVSNTVIGAATVALNDLNAALLALVPPANLVILSRENAGAARPIGIPIEIASFSAADSVVDSQKNRLPNHKRRRLATTP